MKKFLFFIVIVWFSNSLIAQTDIYDSYIILNNGTEQYYDAHTETAFPNFNGTDLGVFNIGDSYLLEGGEVRTWKNGTSDVTGAFLYYRIFEIGSTAPTFIEINLPWAENGIDSNPNNQRWASNIAHINIFSELSAGNYQLEIFLKSTTNEGDKYSNNGGANYKANFTIEDKTILNGKVTVTPSLPKRNEQVTVTLDATGTALETATSVYFHSGIATDEPDSYQFSKSIGNWGLDDGIGQMTQIGTTNEWTITLTSIDVYYSLIIDNDAFALNFLFRDETGSLKEDNGSTNYHLTLDPTNYFLITNPTYNPYLVEIGQPFNITAEANTSANWTLKELDENGVVINASLNTSTTQNYTFSHSLLDVDVIHYYELSVNFSGEIKTKTFQIQAYGAIVTATIPTGFRKGINYNFPNSNDVTFVLHTPTNTTYKYFDSNDCENTSTVTTASKNIVHLIGDFNNWEISNSYQLNKDGDYWWITLNTTTLSPVQDEYVFQYLVDGEIRIGDPYGEKVSDSDNQYIDPSIYPSLISYPSTKTNGRATVLEVNKTAYTWQIPAFARNVSSNNLNIYELHFRDFTNEGTYKAATAKLDYIKEMGINCIHVMPVSEFEGNDSWGYNPNYYFAADKAYGTANDLKEFIDEAHVRGIAVVNDLVLNHAFYSNAMAMLYWNKTLNRPADDNPWFNAEHKGIYDTAGHWGADWNHASEHTQNMVDDILNYWLQEFKFDGFRFDFTKGFTQADTDLNDPWASSYDTCRIEILKRMVNQMWANNSGTYAIFEHLANDLEDAALADHGVLMWSGAGPQHSWEEMAMGTSTQSFWSSVYSSRSFNLANYMSYMESHDEERIGYKVKTWGLNYATNTDGTAKYLSDRLKLPAAFNMLLPGPRMVWQFGELGYDVSIDVNGRTGEKPTAWELGYDNDTYRQQIYSLYSHLFNFRNTFNLYHANEFPAAISVIDYGNISSTSDWVRRMSFSDGTDNGTHNQTQVIAVGNFDSTSDNTVIPGYYFTGDWFKYNGDPAVDGTKYTVNVTSDEFNLFKNDPVYILSNADIIIPQITAKISQINSLTICDYTIPITDTQYNFSEEVWVANVDPSAGHATDNGTISELYFSKINGVDTVTKPTSLEGVTLQIGENLIEWVVKDNFGNINTTEQIINVTAALNIQPVDAVVTNSSTTIYIDNPNTNYTYNWYNSETATTPIFIGDFYDTGSLAVSTNYWVEANHNVSPCISDRVKVSITVNETGTLGINDIKNIENSVFSYPNPTKGSFEIKVPQSQNEVYVELYTIQSQLISSKTYPVIDHKIKVTIDTKTTGLYFAKVYLNNPITLKIIKQ